MIARSCDGVAFIVACLALVARAVAGSARIRSRALPSCPIFPADNPWNQRVDGLPVARELGAS